jgi:hypothetical protein
MNLSSSTRTTTLSSNTVTADTRSVFQRLGEVIRVFVQPGGRRADAVLRTCKGYKPRDRGAMTCVSNFSLNKTQEELLEAL